MIEEKILEELVGHGNAQTVESYSAASNRWWFMLEFTHRGPRKEVVEKRMVVVVVEERG